MFFDFQNENWSTIYLNWPLDCKCSPIKFKNIFIGFQIQKYIHVRDKIDDISQKHKIWFPLSHKICFVNDRQMPSKQIQFNFESFIELVVN